MPSFRYDISDVAELYVRGSIKDKGGNAGQDSLISDLGIDLSCIITVHIAGDDVDTSVDGSIKFDSSHPEAIEQILKQGEDTFDEFCRRLESTSTEAYQGSDIIEDIRQDKVDEAFEDL